MHQHLYTVFIIVALILFSIIRRVRRNIGWQQLNHVKIQILTIIFLIIGLVFLGEGVFHPISLISDLTGILIGMILAYYSAAILRFEYRNGSWYYRPNTWIGIIVSVIFFGRLVYRFYEMNILGGLVGGQTLDLQNMANTTSNSWSAGLMLIMFAYYFIFYIILLKKRKQLLKSSEKLTDK